uniref:Dipeptidase n=1 Tax=Diabrotica virgifera virgifera TaxID=50390 RepID=A0A6P7F1P1_DIAVI
MTQGTVKFTKKHGFENIFQEVISGNYPAHNVNRMNITRLKHLVVRLVEFTSIQVSAKIRPSVCETNLTNNLSLDSEVLVPKLQNKNNYKEFRSSLKRVVIDCCDFFKTCSPQWPPHGKSFENDENFDFIQAKAEKRRLRNSYSESTVSKRRKTLLPCNEKKCKSQPYIPLSRCVPGPQEPSKPLTQADFLGIFKLNLNNNEIPKPQVPNSTKPNRLQNCPNIPLSSDLGQLLIKLENHKVPSSVSERKLDKLQWYINRDSQPITNVQFEVSYCPNKKNTNLGREYKFPVKQHHQLSGNHHFEKFKYKLCKPLTVVLQNEDLFWAAYVPCDSQYKDAVQLTLEQIDVIRRLTDQYNPRLTLCTSSEEIKSAYKRRQLCSLIGVEGGHSLAGSLAVLRTLYHVGVRYLTLTSTCNTPWADCSHADLPGKKPEHGGLTNFGKSVIKEMNRLGMIVDLSHVSVNTMRDALEVSKAPVIFSHSSAHALCNSTRNVPDDTLRKLAMNKGVIMVNFYSLFLTCKEVSTIADAVAHINHIREVAGVDSVGIGAGYDGINYVPQGLEDVSSYPTLFAELIGTGKWTVDDLKKLAGLNFLRVFQEAEKIRDEFKKANVPPYEDVMPKPKDTNCSSQIN